MSGFVSSLSVLCCLALLTACSGGSTEEAVKTGSQVAVKVNGSELSIHQVNEQIARLGGAPPEKLDFARKQVVEGLVDQQLLLQQAAEQKLERDPAVLVALEQSRAQVLTQAYLQKALAAQVKPSVDEVSKYYREHPALFAERRVFRLQELSTDFPADRVSELEGVVTSARSLSEVATWLQKNRAQVLANSAVRGPEQLPLEQVAAINAMKDGAMAVFVLDRKVTVLQVLASQPQPIDEAKALPLIEQFLANSRREGLARAEIKRLRDAASIEYVGDFARLASLETPALVPTVAAPTAASPALAAAPAASAPGNAAIDKGMAGLR